MRSCKFDRYTWLLGPFLAGSLGLGCLPPQRPYLFSTPQMAREPIEALSASFTQLGQVPGSVDPQQGLIQTRWEDTHRHALPLKEQETVIVRRFVAKLDHLSFGNEVTLSSEARRCIVAGLSLTETDIRGTCEPLARLDEPLQKELLALGSRLQQAMSIP